MSEIRTSMHRRQFLKYLPITAASIAAIGLPDIASLAIATPKNADRPSDKPNILLIVADDLGVEIGCYGDKFAKTPNIDTLAEKGVFFETAWVTSASCSPSRSSIHTGLYPNQNGMLGLSHRGYSMHKKYPTIASLLKDAGYSTGVIGKYHIEPKAASPWDYKYTNEMDPDLFIENRDVRTIAKLSRGFMSRTSGRPFFLMTSYFDPHRPLYDQRLGLPEDPVTGKDTEPLGFLGVDTEQVRQETAAYYNCISRLDTGIGMLLDALRETGQMDNTLIIFIGDHGAPFSRAKTTCYDVGLRIPFIVKYPSKMTPGLVRKEMVSTIDILPTILDSAGLEAPRGLPGKSLLPLLENRHIETQWREYLFGEHNAHQHFSWFPRRTVRNNRYQLIENLRPGKENPIKAVDGCAAWEASKDPALKGTQVRKAYDIYARPPRYELYDLKEDPYGFVNLAEENQYASIKKELAARLDEWRKESGDPLMDSATLDRMNAEHDKIRRKYDQEKV